MAQRLTRARAKIRDAGIPYRVPPAHLIVERLDALLRVIYLIFNEGYSASAGDALLRRDLTDEAIRLARVLVGLLSPSAISAEARGLLALLLLHDSRAQARQTQTGALVLLEDQDRSRWDAAKIREGTTILDEAMRWGRIGSYQVQAAISALHAAAPTYADTDWQQIEQLYGVLEQLHPSPVVTVNRAVARGMAHGLSAGLDLLLPLRATLDDYYPFHAACADLLRRSHQREAAADAYARALALCGNEPERAYLRARRDEMHSR
jgi:RNA polymerase sigma-70 factor (ECF subfamily)